MRKTVTILFVFVLMLVFSYSIQAQPTTYVFNSNFYKYGTVDLSTGAFTSLDFFPPGSNYQPVTGDNLGTDEQLQ